MMGRKNSFFTNMDLDPVTGCWNWTGHTIGRDPWKYGAMKYMGKETMVHRLAASFYLGFDLNSDKHICHRCDNTLCFNPKHLFVGTNQDNQRDAVQKGRNWNTAKVMCINGHPYEGENLCIQKRLNGRPMRVCRICKNQRQREYTWRHSH